MRTLKDGDAGVEVVALQQLLNERVIPPPDLLLDGMISSPTTAAIKQFQAAMGLEDNGVVDDKTWKALGLVEAIAPPGVPKDAPRWMVIAAAEKMLGVRRSSSPKHDNKYILSYLKSTDLSDKLSSTDRTAWCAAFVNWCMLRSQREALNSARAREWADYGSNLETPKYGAITVIHTIGKHKASDTSSGYHVGFFESEDKTSIKLLGGNESHAVEEKSYSVAHPETNIEGKWEVIAYRWPPGT